MNDSIKDISGFIKDDKIIHIQVTVFWDSVEMVFQIPNIIKKYPSHEKFAYSVNIYFETNYTEFCVINHGNVLSFVIQYTNIDIHHC